MSDNIIVTPNYQWSNEHNNLHKQVLRRYQIDNGTDPIWKDGLDGIMEMIKQVKAGKERLRSYGGKWSLSDVAICNDSIHDSKPLKFFASIGEGSIVGKPLFPDDPKPYNKRLFFFQSGAQIMQINNALEKRGFCLPTTGASNGQTIAGAVSTGTHGAAFTVGAMQDYVRALHIVTDEDEHYFIQPKSNPVINKNFSNIFGAKLKNDDDLFYSALVSFGSFGVIHGLIIETVSLYMLEAYCKRVDYNDAETLFPALAAFDHSKTDNLKDFQAQFGLPKNADPYHIRVIINPYESKDNAFLEVMYKRKYSKPKLSPLPDGSGRRVGDDILSVIGGIALATGDLVPSVVSMFFGEVAEEYDKYIQTPRNIFGDSTIQKPKDGGASTELGVPIDRAQAAIRLVMQKAVQANFLGVIGVRFVKPSKATLAFTRFAPITCTIELPGLNSGSTQAFYRSVFGAMDAAAIPFTLHWGQEGDYSRERLDKMYGASVNAWQKQRTRLLPESLQRYMFTNDFTKRCGLNEPAPLQGGDVIA